MQQNLDNITLVSYDDTNADHRKFKRRLLSDDEFRRHFGDMFIKNADEIFEATENIELKKAYLILKEENIIGMFRIFSYHESGVVNIQYAVDPKQRRQGYGSLILKELTDFLFKNGIECVEGEIDSRNIGSIKVASNIGFENTNQLKYKLRRNYENRHNETEE